MHESNNCAIIGAGLVGLCTALEFLNQGYRVTLIDRQEPGLGASYGNAGFIASEAVDPLATADTIRKALPMLIDQHGALAIPIGNFTNALPWLIRFVLSAKSSSVDISRNAMSDLLQQAVPAWKKLLAREKLSDYLIPCHYMRVWENSNGVDAAKSEQEFYQKWGIDAEYANKERVFELEPALKHSIHHAVLLPHAHRVKDPYLLCKALEKSFIQKGGFFQKGEVSAVTPNESRVNVITDQGTYTYDKAVICAGAHSAKLLQTYGVNIPLMAERGYHLNFPMIKKLLNGPVCSAERNVFINSLDGGLRVVGFSELGGVNLPANPKRFITLRHHIQSILPQTEKHLNQASEWMGMRPTLPDSLPIIDTHPNHAQIGFAFGHQHVGLTLAATTAQLITAKMLNSKSNQNLTAYKASRFSFVGKFN
ncbi:TPA: FAD-binding oxidoreductase [Acinetobacter baumannii]|nr:FAD-binding oxidoreductase [Acinetobacter baumannii]